MYEELLEYKPYSWRKSKPKLSLLLGCIPIYKSECYEILFEDTIIREYNGLLSDLKDLIFLLNAAYMNGALQTISMKDS